MNCNYDRVGDVPLLICRSGNQPEPKPAILWFHGFGSDSEAHRTDFQEFADAGFVVIGVDAVEHGGRRSAQLEKKLDVPQQDAFLHAIDFASRTASEIPDIIQHLVAGRIATDSRIALVGISMGAFTVYRAIANGIRVAKAVAILGTPEWPGAHSPHLNLEAFCKTDLLSITAEADENVPPFAAKRLHQCLELRCPDRHRYVEVHNAVHLMNAQDWRFAMSETQRWLTS